MKERLIFFGGLLNAAFFVFHILLAMRIGAWDALPVEARALLGMSNTGSILVLLFFAAESLFYRKGLLGTTVGQTILFLVFVFYAVRAGEEVFVAPRFSPLIFISCLAVALIYLTAWVLSGRTDRPGRRERSSAPGADLKRAT
jgi:hypothetical protein